MKTLTIDWVKKNGLLVFETIAGSKAYGLSTEQSDTDIRGVFILPKEMYYSLEYTPQVSNETNDIVYYELKRFMELLSNNNPNILELLNVPDQFVLYKHAVMDRFDPNMFLSRLCEKTFANYAFTQIKKAYGLEKKIVNPVEEERRSLMDFCYVYTNKDTIASKQFLESKGWQQNQLGLSAIPHLKNCYNIFYSDVIKYSGVMRKDNANDVALSNIPKGESAVGMLYFNKDGYSVYCKKYKEYWEWVEKRNETRYKSTMSHGKNYDAKNMMHVFRLLAMAKEIATEGKINVYRSDRDFLLSIKQGKYGYDELLENAEKLKSELDSLYARSPLPEIPDIESINKLLVEIRKEYYGEN
jgi:predicted nucleotidyltransferase